MNLLHRQSLSALLRKRHVELLLHSTHLYRNLPRILADGCLHTVRTLRETHGPREAARFLHDARRYEQFAVGLDYLNASLSLPNAPLLYHRSKSDWKAEWVHLSLECELLSREDTRFCPVSAAADFGKHVVHGRDGLAAMFAETVEEYSREDLPACVPTHPQAEVLLRGPLEICRVRAILVADGGIAEEVSRLVEFHQRNLRVEVTPHLFVWPERLIRKK